MKTPAILAVALIFAFGAFLSSAQAQEPDSLKVKNEIKTQNQGEDQKLRIRTQEQVQDQKPGESGVGKRVATRNEGEDEKIRVRTEEGDKAKGEAVQARFRDENGDGLPDSTQAKKQEKNRNRIRNQEKKHGESDNLTPQGGPSGKRNKRGSGQGSGSGKQ
jgi:hypothetical protein